MTNNWKTERQMTDAEDRVILQYYNSSKRKFELQREIATNEELEKVVNLLTEFRNENGRSIKEEPAHLKNVEIIKGERKWPFWFHDDKFYATDISSGNPKIYTSEDGKSWDEYSQITTDSYVDFLIVNDFGKLLVGLNNGEVHLSDENGSFNGVPLFTTGRLSRRFGNFKNGHIIGINTYEPHGYDAGKFEAWLSIDNGETFKRVFDKTTLNELPPLDNKEQYHLHAMEYDPYSQRLYVWNGDFGNRTLNYSDDWGETWTALPRGEMGNATQLIATKEGIILCADTNPSGHALLRVDRSKQINPPLNLENYERDFWYYSERRGIATRRWVDRENGVYLVPFISENNDDAGALSFSRDGYNWHKIYTCEEFGNGLGLIGVVYGNDTVLSVINTSDGQHILRATLVL